MVGRAELSKKLNPQEEAVSANISVKVARAAYLRNSPQAELQDRLCSGDITITGTSAPGALKMFPDDCFGLAPAGGVFVQELLAAGKTQA